MPKCIELLPCDWLISNLCYQAIEQVSLLKWPHWPVSVYTCVPGIYHIVGIKCQIKSNQIKSLLLSHHHSTSALVSEILMSVLQIVQKNNRQFTYGQTVQKKQQTIYIWTDSAKKTTNNLHMDRQCKKNNKQFTYGQTVQKKQQTIYIWTDSAKKQQTIYIWTDSAKKQQTIYIWTDSAKKTTNNLHMDRQCKKNNKQFTYGQTVQKKQQTIYIWTDSAKKQQTIYIWTDSAKKQQTIYIWTDSAKKTTNNLHMDRQCKKNNKQFTYGQTVQKKQQTIYIWTDSAKKQQQFTYGQYIFTECPHKDSNTSKWYYLWGHFVGPHEETSL